jgi:hypothetical protein
MVGLELLAHGSEVIDAALAVSGRTRDLCRSSEWLVASARNLRRHRPWISGAADDLPEVAVRDRLREWLKGGVLRIEGPTRVWAGPSANGRRCSLCRRDIHQGLMVYELTRAEAVAIVMDRGCFELWASEVRVAMS